MKKSVPALVSAAAAATLIAAVLISPACAGGGEGEGEDECASVKGFSEITALSNSCVACHSSTLPDLNSRQDAPLGFDYDTYAAATANVVSTRAQVAGDLMPPATGVPISAAEKADLLLWLDCDTPE